VKKSKKKSGPKTPLGKGNEKGISEKNSHKANGDESVVENHHKKNQVKKGWKVGPTF